MNMELQCPIFSKYDLKSTFSNFLFWKLNEKGQMSNNLLSFLKNYPQSSYTTPLTCQPTLPPIRVGVYH